MDLFVFTLSWFVLFGAIGLLIGSRKGRAAAGLIFSMLLGPIGWLLIFLGPDVREQKARREAVEGKPRAKM